MIKEKGLEQMEKTRVFSPDEIQQMKWLMQAETRPNLQRKYHALYLFMQGRTRREIAQLLGRQPRTVGIYVRSYLENGIEGLTPKSIPGRPRWMTPEQEAQLIRVITEQTPHDVGFSHTSNWTAKLAITWVEREFGITYRVSSILDILHRLNLSHTRPNYTLKKADIKKQEAFKKELDALEKK